MRSPEGRVSCPTTISSEPGAPTRTARCLDLAWMPCSVFHDIHRRAGCPATPDGFCPCGLQRASADFGLGSVDSRLEEVK